MTVLAHVRRRNMRRRLSRRANSRGMAQHTVVGNAELLVGKRGRQPRGDGVAQIARCGRRNMIRRLSNRVDDRRGRRRGRRGAVTIQASSGHHMVVINLAR